MFSEKNGYILFEVVSALQKTIRPGFHQISAGLGNHNDRSSP